MTGTHPELGPELRALATSILDKLDPALRQAARAAADGGTPGKCNQLFCPVCALAALVEGEHHPLLATIAEHSLALVMVVRAMLRQRVRAIRVARTIPTAVELIPSIAVPSRRRRARNRLATNRFRLISESS